MKYLLFLLLLPALVFAQDIELPIISKHIEKQLVARDTLTISEPGAAFIKVYFKDISSPIKVRSPDGKEQYTYAPGHWKQATRRGESYGALSISGDTAVVEFLGRGEATITGYDVGLAQSDVIVPEVICGGNDFQWIECVKETDPNVYDRRRPTAKILMLSKGASCTAWRVGPGNKMLTNNHCANTPETIAASEVWFQYEYPTCDATGTIVPIKIPAAELLDTYYELDYTLFTVQDHPALASLGWFGLDPAPAAVGDRIYIVGHPEAKPKRAIVRSDLNTTGLCQIDDASYNARTTDSDYSYHCDSEGGQSGSPVLRHATNRALAIHHYGNVTTNGICGNSGVKMAHIWPRISRFFDGVPGGDNENPAEGPVVRAQVACTDNVCQYASEGTIADSLYWWFGDGGTSTAASGTYTYTIPGLYGITLYGTRNGITDAVLVQTQVSVPGYNYPPRANFTYTLDGLTGTFKSTSYDPEGQPLSRYEWRMRDPLDSVWHTYTTEIATHTYVAPGPDKYVHLRVWDDKGASSQTYYQRFTIPPLPPPPPVCGDGVCNGTETYATCPADCPPPPRTIKLTYTVRKVQGPNRDVTFKWVGAEGETVQLYRASTPTTTANDGTEVVRMHNKEKGARFKVCDTICSNTVTVTW